MYNRNFILYGENKLTKYIKSLTDKDIKDLIEIELSSKYNYREKYRAKCLLLSHKKYTVKELSDIFEVEKRTIRNWINKWENEGINGIYDKKGKGRNKIYSKEEEKIIISLIEKEPRDIKQVLIAINNELNKTSSKDTIKRILDKNHFTWRRIRKITKNKPNEEINKKKVF